MASWTAIAAALTNPFAPITSALVKALEENPRAIAAGASGAPRIQSGAYAPGSVNTAALGNGSVSEPKYETGSVSNRALAENCVTRDKLAASQVGDVDRVFGRDASTTSATFETIFDVSILRGGGFRLAYLQSSGAANGHNIENRVLLNGVIVSTFGTGSQAAVLRLVDLPSVPDGSVIQLQHRRTLGTSPSITSGIRLRNAGTLVWCAPIFGVERVI